MARWFLSWAVEGHRLGRSGNLAASSGAQETVFLRARLVARAGLRQQLCAGHVLQPNLFASIRDVSPSILRNRIQQKGLEDSGTPRQDSQTRIPAYLSWD